MTRGPTLGFLLPPKSALWVKERYSEPHRKYHNVEHVESLLSMATDSVVLVEAAIFHDIVYAPHPVPPGWNEAQSIRVYCEWAREHKADAYLDDLVATCINATAYHTHDQRYLDPVSQEFLDLDLHGFAEPYPEFRRLNDLVMEELRIIYAGVPEQVLIKGRLAFLETMLRRKRIYYVRTDWEDRARVNLEIERRLLAEEE